MKETLKFYFQTLIIPVMLAFVGYKINSTLQEKQQVFDKIKFTEHVLNEAFDAKNADKALALSTLIPQLVHDTVYANKLVELINTHFAAEAAKALRNGNDTIYTQISDAAKTYPGSILSASLKADPVTARAENAVVLEDKGLEQLRLGNLKEAQVNFERADKAYPGFHSSYEISNVLKEKINQVKQGADSIQAKKEVMEDVRTKYSWRINSIRKADK